MICNCVVLSCLAACIPLCFLPVAHADTLLLSLSLVLFAVLLCSAALLCCLLRHFALPVAALQVRGVMDENRKALAERGERLAMLQEQTADLAESAAGFAELAKQLADKEKGKTKWFG